MYYKHAPEITLIFETQPEIEGRARKLIFDLLPAIGDMIVKRNAAIKQETVQEGINFIDELSRQASPSLKEDLINLRQDVQRGVILKTFGVEVQKH